MAQTHEIRTADAKYDVIVPDNLPEVFVDGTVQILMGPTNCKILFYSVSATTSDEQKAQGVEQRKAVQQLTIPLTALIDLASTALNTIHTNVPKINQAFVDYKTKLDESILRSQSVGIQNLPVETIPGAGAP